MGGRRAANTYVRHCPIRACTFVQIAHLCPRMQLVDHNSKIDVDTVDHDSKIDINKVA